MQPIANAIANNCHPHHIAIGPSPTMAFTSGSLAAVAASAAAAALITPTIDEFEQSHFYASASSGQHYPYDVAYDAHCLDATQTHHTLSGLDSIIDASLPHFSFYSPAIDQSLEHYVDCDNDTGRDCFMRIDSSSTSAALTTAAISPVLANAACDDINGGHLPYEIDVNDVMQAAGILCQFKNDVVAECSTEETAELVDMAVEILASSDTQQNDSVVDESLIHPNRLAIDDDAEEVNKLHQYVRKELLEIFVIPQQTASDDGDSEDEVDEDSNVDEFNEASDDEDDSDFNTSKHVSNDTITTRHLRHRSIDVSTTHPSASAQRYYPGRVGLRCTYCANIRRKSTSKAAFYPLRLKNIYREVCAWQRIHFKKCPHVPEAVRERYDHYKRIDTSRGKVRFWESSARKIGLENNPHRVDGIVFSQTAWKA
ncbi:hypothetical protein ACHAWU_004307 [Discostella pseudostelligera]|uniref:Uncharacterized protein n=1 Tax=Discostella pseudostelligera TaxID=259834 RepID=A0ABD3M393_9STRA